MTDTRQPTDPDRDDAEQDEQSPGAPSPLIEDVEPVGGEPYDNDEETND